LQKNGQFEFVSADGSKTLKRLSAGPDNDVELSENRQVGQFELLTAFFLVVAKLNGEMIAPAHGYILKTEFFSGVGNQFVAFHGGTETKVFQLSFFTPSGKIVDENEFSTLIDKSHQF